MLRKLLSPRALALGAIGAPIMALAGPTGGQVAAGTANITAPVPNGTVIDQTSQSAVINWQSFNIGNQEYVQFNQPDSSSVVLNRVVGGDASSILGSLSANGRVFLVNPQGVFFGAGATLDVGGLVATTMDISDSDFMSGHYVFTKADGSVSASVVNAGAIQAHPGGYVVLAGDYTENSGVISAQAGQVVLAAGSQMTLDIGSGGLISYAVDQATLSSLAGVKNAGEIIADGGAVLMTAKVANALTATAVNNSGVITAHSVQEHDGVIILAAQGGGIEDSGTLDASASETGVAGGYIRIRGDGHTEITSTANIDAAGSGARGGFVELSGHSLSLRGQTRLGHSGTLLIDPVKLSIATGSTAPSSTGATTYQVGVGYITTQLNLGNNVVLVASSSIGHAAGVTSLTATGGGNLTLKTGTLNTVTTGASLGPVGFQCWADGVCASPAIGGAGATFTPTSGLISLNGMSINIAGAFEANAGNGTVNVGNVTAKSVTVVADQITVGNLVTSGSAGINLAASDGAASVQIATGSLTANGAGGIVLKTNGSANGSIIVGGVISAGGALTASAAVTGFGGNIDLVGAATAKRITVTAQALSGGNITAQGLHANGLAISDGIMLSALASGGASSSGGNVNVSGGISADKGGIGINATGGLDSGGIISVTGNIQAAGLVNINATNVGSCCGHVSLANVTGSGIYIHVSATGSPSSVDIGALHATGTGASNDVSVILSDSGSPGSLAISGAVKSSYGGVLINAGQGSVSLGANPVTAATFINVNGGSIHASGATFSAGQSVQVNAGSSIAVGNVSAPKISLQANKGNLYAGNLKASSSAAPVSINVGTGPSGTTGGTVSIGSIIASGKEGSHGASGASVNISARANSGANVTVGGITLSAAKAHYTRSSSYTSGTATVQRTSSGSSGRANLAIHGGGSGASVTVNGAISVTGHGIVGVSIDGAPNINVTGAIGVTDSGGGSRTFTWLANSAGKTQTMHRVAPKWGAANVNISGVMGSSAGSVSLGNVTVNGAFGTIFIQGGTIATGALTATAYGRSSDVRSGSLVVGSITKTLSSSDNNFGSANVTVQAFGGSSANVNIGGAIAATANGGQANVSLHGAHVVTKGITVSASASHVNLAGDVIPSSASYVFNYRNFKYTPDTLTLGANLTHGTASMGIAHIDIAGAMPLGTGTGTGSPAPALSYSASGNLSATGVGDASVKIDSANVNITGGITVVATAAHMNMSGATSGGVTTHISGSLGAAGVRITGGSASSDSVTVTGPISATGPIAQVQVSGKHMSLGSVSASGTGLNRTVTQTNSASSNIYSSHTTQGPARVELTGGSGSFDALSSVNVGNVTVAAAGGASAQLHAGNVVAGNVAASFTPGSRTVTGFPTGLNSIATFSGSGARMQIGAYSSASVGNLSAPNVDVHTKHGALVTGNLTASSANAPVMISVQGGTSGSGASVSINGNVTASGRGSAGSANPFNGAGAAATVQIDSGYGAHSVNITGSINVSGAAAPVSAHSSDSYTYALVGSLGRADLTIGQSSTTGATINVGGGITVAGAGAAHAELIATSVNVGGTLKVSATPTTLTQSSTHHYGSGSLASSGAMHLTQTAGIADLTISAPESASGSVQLGAVTVSGTVGSVSIRGHSVTTGNITVNTAPGTFDLTSSGHSTGGSFALTSNASAGIARVEVIAGTSTSSGTASLGAVNISGNGLAAIHVGAGTINVGAITVSGGAGTFTRTQSGSPHYYGSLFKGPMALWQSVGLDQGSAAIGVASVALDGRLNSYGSYGRPPGAASVNIGGAIAVTGKSQAHVDLIGDTVTVASTVSVSAAKGTLQGSAHFLQGTSGGASYQVARTVSDSVGSADISLGHSGGTSVAVGGAMSATGTAAGVEVQGANISVMGISATGTGGGHVSEAITYTPTGSQGTAFSATFKGPGDITGVRLIGAPSGSMNVQGDIVIQGKGFVGAIIADGTVNTRNISLTASGSATYQVTDTRNATPTQTFKVGDVGLAIGQMAGSSAVSPATITGGITLTATRDVELGIAGSVSGAVKVAAGRDIVGVKPAFLNVIDKARSGPSSSGSSTVFPTPDITASAAEFTAGRNINLSGANVTIGSGSIAGMTGDSKAAALAGLASGAAPDAVFDAGASLKMPNFTLTGSYAWLKAGQFTSAGSANIASGALVQISPHASASSIGINASGTGSQATMLGVTPFLGGFTGGGTIAIGGTNQTGGIVLAGNVNLGSANVILLTSGVVSGSGKLVSGGLALVTSGTSTSLVVQTPVVNFQGSGALTVDDTAYTGTASFNLGTGTLTTVSGNFGGNVNLMSPVNASAFTLTAAGSANLGGQVINVTNAAAFKVGTSFAASSATINAGSLTLNGGSATDFTVTANAATISIGSGRNIAIDDTFAGPATMAFGAGSFGTVAVNFAMAGTLTGSFTAQGLHPVPLDVEVEGAGGRPPRDSTAGDRRAARHADRRGERAPRRRVGRRRLRPGPA